MLTGLESSASVIGLARLPRSQSDDGLKSFKIGFHRLGIWKSVSILRETLRT
jgi:hypothetical protein